ncbi:MAG: glycosyltransferase [Paucibacter sp.]|nr:glycosyltransferase [Roseateles sp.]
MIAFHFPPQQGSSGIQRTLRFVQHMGEHQWQPLVLTASKHAYENISSDLESEIPKEAVIHRSFALDSARHLSIHGRYLSLTATPDRWASWRWTAVRAGMVMIEKFKPDVIWSTYPIATAHWIGAELQRRSGLPWVADFRDPMVQADMPYPPVVRRSLRYIEARAMQEAKVCCFTTQGAAELYQDRYSKLNTGASARIEVLENGYDESSFVQARQLADKGPLNPGAITLLHSGVVYPHERDPSALMQALGQLKQQGVIESGKFFLRFRASVHEGILDKLARAANVREFIELCPPIPYVQALNEMLRADGLLLIQAANCNAQIPAKYYEYIRSQRPIIALTDPAGNTAQRLRLDSAGDIIPPDSPDAIAAKFRQFITAQESWPLADTNSVMAASRQSRTVKLIEIFNSLTPAKQAL